MPCSTDDGAEESKLLSVAKKQAPKSADKFGNIKPSAGSLGFRGTTLGVASLI